MQTINDITGGYTRQIDVIAHSQAAAIVRFAIRTLAEQGIYPVNLLISLGGGNYGISVTSQEFNTAILGAAVNERYSGLLRRLVAQIAGAAGLATCRATGFLPVCRDIVRAPGTAAPDPANPDPTLYATDFYKILNDRSPGTVGPVPGPTNYVHLYSRNFLDYSPPNLDTAEAIELYDADGPGNRVINKNVQSLCGPNYGVHHVREWVEPPTRALMLQYLGFGTATAASCHHN
jgi:hypothetical protein